MSNIDLLKEELLKNVCKNCRYFNSEDQTCSYGATDRFISVAIEEFLLGKVCTFEGDLRFINKENKDKIKFNKED